MGRHKKTWGITRNAGGIIHLYDELKLIRSKRYKRREHRQDFMNDWRNDLKRLKPTGTFYFVIEPNIHDYETIHTSTEGTTTEG